MSPWHQARVLSQQLEEETVCPEVLAGPFGANGTEGGALAQSGVSPEPERRLRLARPQSRAGAAPGSRGEGGAGKPGTFGVLACAEPQARQGEKGQ